MNSRLWVLAGLIGVGILLAGQLSRSSGRATPAAADAPQAVAHLMALTLPDAEGQAQPLVAWQGKILLVNFWAPWCLPCREEMPLLDAAQRKWGARGFQVVAVAMEEAGPVRDYAHTRHWDFPLLVGADKVDGLVSELGNTGDGIPYSVLIDAQGKLRYTKLGAFGADELDALIQSLAAPAGAG